MVAEHTHPEPAPRSSRPLIALVAGLGALLLLGPLVSSPSQPPPTPEQLRPRYQAWAADAFPERVPTDPGLALADLCATRQGIPGCGVNRFGELVLDTSGGPGSNTVALPALRTAAPGPVGVSLSVLQVTPPHLEEDFAIVLSSADAEAPEARVDFSAFSGAVIWLPFPDAPAGARIEARLVLPGREGRVVLSRIVPRGLEVQP